MMLGKRYSASWYLRIASHLVLLQFQKTLEIRPIWTTFSCFVNSKIILFHGSMTFWLWYHIILVPTPFLGELSLNLHSTTKRNIFQVLFYFLSLLTLLLLFKRKKTTSRNNFQQHPRNTIRLLSEYVVK